MNRVCWIGLAVFGFGIAQGMPAPAAAQEYQIVASSFLGGSDFDDAVVGACIQSDGTVVLAANLAPDILQRIKVQQKPASMGGKSGCIVRLSADGRKALSLVAVAAEVKDLAIDEKDHLYVAAGRGGILKLSSRADQTVWDNPLGECSRVDAGSDGNAAAIVDGNIVILDPAGKQIGSAKGNGFTNDVCIDSRSKTAIFCGFRNAHAFDGKRTYPVQICYIHGLGYDGSVKWTDYDWSTDRDSDRFLNKPTNNMADTRADRCAMGRDGKLYVTFQVAGGNHIFRYDPKDLTKKAELAGGDKYHQFYNSRAEHKNVFCRYEPATGDYLAGQQFCGRLSSGRANAVVTKEGDIGADEQGRVYVVGKAAYGLPVTMTPDDNDYTGGGFILVMSPDLKTRLLCTRTAGGKGSPRSVDARTVSGNLRAVFGGSGMPEAMFVKDAVQPKPADRGEGKEDPRDGFYVVLEAE